MHNSFGADCCECGLWVKPRAGYAEQRKNKWRIRHVIQTDKDHLGITCEAAMREAFAPSIKDKYEARQLSYEDALAQLEALGMREGDADDYLSQDLGGTSTHSSQHHSQGE